MTTDQQLSEAIAPILAAAKALDHRIESICVSVGIADVQPPFIKFYGGNLPLGRGGEYGIEANLATVTPYNPKAEKLAAIEKLRAELAALETEGK